MLTKVILEGPMGKAFGREWAFAIDSPQEALRMVEANKPGVFNWIRANLEKYAAYRVVCEYEGGRTEELDKDSYMMIGKPTSIRFVPLLEGAGGGIGKIIGGAILYFVGMYLTVIGWGVVGGAFMKMGAAMMIGGVIELLTPRPSKTTNDNNGQSNVNSSYFNGPVNNEAQGSPVPLIYGRVLVGSHAISAAVTVDQLM